MSALWYLDTLVSEYGLTVAVALGTGIAVLALTAWLEKKNGVRR